MPALLPLLSYFIHGCSLPYVIHHFVFDQYVILLTNLLLYHMFIAPKYQIRQMSKCFDQRTTFLDTHSHFRRAIEISRICPIVCGGLELKKRNLKNKNMLGFTAYVSEIPDFQSNMFWTPCVQKQGLSNAQFKNYTASELWSQSPLNLYTLGAKYIPNEKTKRRKY